MDPLIPSTCIREPITLLKLVGMWLPKEQPDSKSTRLQYRIYSFTVKLWFVYIYTFSEVVKLFYINDMEVMSTIGVNTYMYFSKSAFLYPNS